MFFESQRDLRSDQLGKKWTKAKEKVQQLAQRLNSERLADNFIRGSLSPQESFDSRFDVNFDPDFRADIPRKVLAPRRSSFVFILSSDIFQSKPSKTWRLLRS